MFLCPNLSLTYKISFVLWYSTVPLKCRKVLKLIFNSRVLFNFLAIVFLLSRKLVVQLHACIGKPHEDPDSYAFTWPDEAIRELKLQEPTSPRFFDLKLIYDTVTADLTKETLGLSPVFVGAYCTPVVRYVGRPTEYRLIEKPQSVCVAVRRETDPSIHVVHVETREGKLDKAWIRGLAKQLKAKKNHMIAYDSLKEDARRSLLLKLRSVFEQHTLLISSRYAALIEDLREFSYRKLSSGYVLGLAIAVDLCLD